MLDAWFSTKTDPGEADNIARLEEPVDVGSEDVMGTYVMLTTVGPDGWARSRSSPSGSGR